MIGSGGRGGGGLPGVAGSYDVVIIGGGINGAGIARLAARSGYTVLLVDKQDFGWGTTWRSSKLIHGGLRYLEHAELGLVFEALRDQQALLADYPQMVRPLSFLLPVYRNDRHRVATIGLGLTLYDALSAGRALPRHRRYSSNAARALEPGLSADGLTGAFTYSDCQVAYPERLCIQTVLEARDAGATVLNHTEVTGLLQRSGRIAGVVLTQAENAASVDVQASLVVNAGGPWVDAILGELPERSQPLLGGTKGVHIVVDYAGAGPLHAVYAEAQSDHRPYFVLPWRGLHLIGTTDTRYEGSPDTIRADDADINYLVNEATRLLPATPLHRASVLYAYAGIRPLPASEGLPEGAVTRRHVIRDHAAEGHAGLISIIGGKLSTYRSLAAQTLARIRRYCAPSRTCGGMSTKGEQILSVQPSIQNLWRQLSPLQSDYLRSLYGPRLPELLAAAASMEHGTELLCPHGPDIAAQIALAVRDEHARTLADAMLRRTGVGWNRCLGRDAAPGVAALMARELGWSTERIATEVTRYEREVASTFTSGIATV